MTPPFSTDRPKRGKTGYHIPHFAFLIPVLLLAFALRLFRLDAQSLWWDEGISLHLATSSLAEIAADRVVNIHPPLYFFGLKAWVSLVGLTPFAARYSSLLASLLQVTAVYAFSRRWLGNKTAVWTAVALIVISPLSIIYGQEIRVYAILPLIYLALLTLTGRITQNERGIPRSLWIGLVIVEVVGLHLHYIVLFLAAFISVWALLIFSRRREWGNLRRWIAAQLAVGLLSLPWFIAILLNRLTVQNRVQTGTFLTEPVSWRFLLSQVWVFHLTGLPGLLARPAVKWLSVWAAFSLVGLLWLRWRQRRVSLPLLGNWLIPLVLALLIWSVRSFSHPRYIAIYAIGLIPLAAYLIGSGPRSRWTAVSGIVLGLPLVLLSLWGLWAYYFDPGAAKDDVRGAALYLETTAAPDDLIVIPDTDWSLPFEYDGQTSIIMPGLDSGGDLWANWAGGTAVPGRIFVMDYPRGTRDWQRVTPFALEKAGALVDEIAFDGLVVREYSMQRPLSPPAFEPAAARFGPLVLEAAWIEDSPPADSAVTLALRWQAIAEADGRYQAALRLLDEDGWELAREDDALLDRNGRPTDQWQIGQPTTTYHILPIPTGTPPLEYAVALAVYAPEPDGPRPLNLLDEQGAPQGQQMTLAHIRLTAPLGHGADPYRAAIDLPALPNPIDVAEGLQLVTAVPDRDRAALGQSVFVQLEWRSTAYLPDLRPRLALVQNGVALAAADDAPALGRYPTDQWSLGERVRERRRLTVPPDAPPGPAELILTLGDGEWSLGAVNIEAGNKLFDRPEPAYPLAVRFGDTARLIGYDLPLQTAVFGEPLPLTLYWEALTTGTPVDYTVFAHILAEDGHLIGQHDSPPGNGRAPTTGWLTGEYIIDSRQLRFVETEYAGSARIEVGLYDPATGARLTTETGTDYFYLPAVLTIRP